MNYYQINVKHSNQHIRGTYDRKQFHKDERLMLEALRAAVLYGHSPTVGEMVYAGEKYYMIEKVCYFGNYMIYWVNETIK